MIVVSALSLGLAACGDKNVDAKRVDFQEDITSAIGVNGFLWRASLDTMAELPILQVDSAGGVILTDWFVNPDAPTERLRVSIFILDRTLRADALRVNVVRQELTDGVWANATVRAGTQLKIEDAVLSRARELRISAIEEDE